jgi:hypothetical protein
LAAATRSSTPFSGESRPAYSTSGGSAGGETSAGRSTPLGITSTRPAPSARASSASQVEAAITRRARRKTGRASNGTCCASSMSVPQTWTTYGFRSERAITPAGSQCA